MNKWSLLQRGTMTLIAIPLLFWLAFYSDTLKTMSRVSVAMFGVQFTMSDADFYVRIVLAFCCTVLVTFVVGHLIDVKRLSTWNKDFSWAIGITLGSGFFLFVLIAVLVVLA